ncbi:MAG: UDP-2,3-diacylglucosamine diphosphatase LpxI [Magnetococcus sp. WYHC-3]
MVPLGMVAGGGRLPTILAESLARNGGPPLAVVALRGEADPALQRHAAHWGWVHPGQFRKTLTLLRRFGAREVVLAGRVRKVRLWNLRPDTLALRMALGLRHTQDDHLLRAVAGVFESHGVRVRGVGELLPSLLAPAGVLTRREPTAQQWQDVRFGWNMARALGTLDIGQGVVVRGGTVVAVEALEGTDAMLARAGALCPGQGVFVKTCKPQQDRRLDLPAVGPETLRALAAATIPVLAVEAGGVLLLDLEETLALAERHGIAVVGCEPQDMERQHHE